MKIVDVSVTLFTWRNIPAVQYSDRNPIATPTSELGLVKLVTDEGIEGHAFLGSSIRGARLDVVALMRHLKPVVMGRDPLERGLKSAVVKRPDRAARRQTAHHSKILLDRGQRRVEVRRQRDVVETDDRNLFGHAPSGLPQGAQGADRHAIVLGENGRKLGRLLHQSPRAGVARGRRPIPGDQTARR